MSRIDILNGIPNEAEFKKLSINGQWDAVDIANIASYVDYDVDKAELILRTSAQFGLHYMDICQHINKPIKVEWRPVL